MENSPRSEFERLREELKSSQIGYLLSDLELGATFAKMAMESRNEEKRARTTREARIAYDTVYRFMARVSLTKTEKKIIGEQLGSLKSDLETLGETF